MQPLRLALNLLVCVLVAGCGEEHKDAATDARPVRVVAVSTSQYQPSAEITGEVKARVQTTLSFRVQGRVTERLVDIGSRVRAGDVLARIDSTESKADVSIAQAGLDSAKATLLQKTLAYQRYGTLIQSRAISQATYDQAREDVATAQASVQTSEASLGTALDTLAYTELKADADGVITTRTIEVGQVVSAAQTAFTLAQSGPRDAVFNVFEAFFLKGRPLADVDVFPVEDRSRKARATIREVSPTIDSKAGTVRVKVTLPDSADWPLGTAVVGMFVLPTQRGVVLPWSAMTSARGEPAVWVVDAASRTASLRPVSVSDYRTGDFVVTDGLAPKDLIVTEGAKFLREGQVVAWEAN